MSTTTLTSSFSAYLKNKRLGKSQKAFVLLSSAVALVASGDTGSTNKTNSADTQRNTPTNGDDVIVIGSNSSNEAINSGSGNDAITGNLLSNIINSGAGDDVVNAGAGDDVINGGDGADLIRGGAGNDKIYGGAGKDNLVVVGSNANGKYTASDITNPNNSGVDLSELISVDDVNNNAQSDVAQGGVIDGGADGANLYIYGEVDLTNVTLNNITLIDVHSILTISAAQLNSLIEQGLEGILGDGDTFLIIENSSTEVVVDLSSFDLDGVGHLKVGNNVTLIADQADIDTITKIQGNGSIQASGAQTTLDLSGTNGSTGHLTVLDNEGTNVANAPEFGSNHTANVAENSIDAGIFAATDADVGDVVGYSLSGADEDFFTISATGQLEFKTPPNFENPQSDSDDNVYQLTVTATSGSQSTDHDVAITVTNVVEDMFEFGTLTTEINLDENLSVVDTFAATGAGEHEITYTVPSDSLFNISLLTGELSFKSAPDFETDPHTYSVVITAEANGETITHDVVVNVTNVNDNTPTIEEVPANILVNENTTYVHTFVAADLDGDVITYSLGDNLDESYFHISQSTGELSFEEAPNADGVVSSFYLLEVKATAGGETVFESLGVTVVNVNDNSPEFTDPALSVDVYENSTAVDTFTATDEDGDLNPVTYSVAENSPFKISATGELSFITEPDFEIDPKTYTVEITAEAGGETITHTVTVNVLNILEGTPEFDALLATSVNVSENATAVDTFAVSGNDIGLVTYSVPDDSPFTISATGELSFKVAPDFETDPQHYDVEITAEANSMTLTHDVGVNVTNLNDNSPEFAASSAAIVNVDENTINVDTFSVTDADFDRVTFSVPDESPFTISVTGELSFKLAPDFETDPHSYNVEITAKAGGETVTHSVVVNVTNLNDNTPTFDGSPALTVNVDENTTEVDTFTATDADGDVITYSVPDDGPFAISATGVLTFKEAPDFETDPQAYNVQITAEANGETITHDVTVNVDNVDETSPEFGDSLPHTISVYENTTAVGTYAASDEDGDTVTYELSGDHAAFTISSAGILSFIEMPDFEADAEIYNLVIEATSGGETVSHSLAITLLDTNDNAPEFAFTSSSVTIDENTTSVVTLPATDADNSSVLVYGITGDDAGLFTVNIATGALEFSSAPDFDDPVNANNIYNVTLGVSDGVQSDEYTIIVTVADVDDIITPPNEAPLFAISTPASIEVNENSLDAGIYEASDANGDIVTYSLGAGDDNGLFTIDENTGVLKFNANPDFELPADGNQDNSYIVQVIADDGTEISTLDLTLEVQNQGEEFSGTDGNDNPLLGSAENDVISGLGGNDAIFGLAGNDVLNGGEGADFLHGGAGTDLASYEDATSGVIVHTGWHEQNTGEAAGDSYASIEGLIGSDHDDELIIVANNSELYGGAGNDQLTAAGINATIYGGDGNDGLYANAGQDTLYGGAGNDALFGYNGNDTLIGGTGNDYLNGGAGDDDLNGGEGDDNIDAGAGNDNLIGGLGADHLHGGAGDDTYSVDNADDWVIEHANDGIDQVNASVSFALSANVENLTLLGTAISATGNEIGNILIGNDEDNIIQGLAGNDALSGGLGNDTFIFNAGDGTDTVVDFTAHAGAADGDIIEITGHSFVDYADFLNNLTEVDGSTHIDLGNGDVIILENVLVVDLTEADFSFTPTPTPPETPHSNTLIGTESSESLYGNYSSDSISGLGGNDNLFGYENNDRLEGGEGHDWLVGGSGNDVFVFKTNAGWDGIADFETHNNTANGDVIELHGQTALNIDDLLDNATEWNGVSYIHLDNGDGITLHDVTLDQLTSDDFTFIA